MANEQTTQKKIIKGLIIVIVASVIAIVVIACATQKGYQKVDSAKKASISFYSKAENNNGKVEKSNNDDEVSKEVNEVICNTKDVKITYTGYQAEELFSSACLKFTIENNSQKNINVSTLKLNVNGYTITTFVSEDVPAGKKANMELNLYSTELEKNNIKTIGNIEFSLKCVDDSYNELFTTDTITVTFDEEAAKQTDDTSNYQLVHEQNGVQVFYTGCEDEGAISKAEFKFLVVNNSEKNVRVSADNMSINDYAFSDLFYADCEAGKKTNETITLYDHEAEKNNIDKVDKLEFTLKCIDDNYHTLWETNPITIKL